MPVYDYRVLVHRRETSVACSDHPVDAAAGRIVDERIDAVPEHVGDMNDVGFCEGDGDIAVGVRGPVIFQADRGSVELKLAAVGKDFAGDSARAERKEIV